MDLAADRWIRASDPSGSDRVFIGFTFVDPDAGLSARGAVIDWPATRETAIEAAEFPDTTIPLAGLDPIALTPSELATLNLPQRPEWLEALAAPAFFSATDHPWRDDPAMRDSGSDDNPDHFRASFYAWPEPNVESLWVELRAADPAVGGYNGVLLDEPESAEAPTLGSRVSIRVAPGAGAPVWVSPAMRANLARWSARCAACGFDMLMTPAELISEQFPDAPDGCVPLVFTTPCDLCRGQVAVETRV